MEEREKTDNRIREFIGERVSYDKKNGYILDTEDCVIFTVQKTPKGFGEWIAGALNDKLEKKESDAIDFATWMEDMGFYKRRGKNDIILYTNHKEKIIEKTKEELYQIFLNSNHPLKYK